MPPTKERTPELRERILGAARDLLVEGGPSAVTTRRVAQAAGTSAPAIYELFGDKAGLVRELYFDGFRRLISAFDLVPHTDDPATDLAAALHAFRAFARRDPVRFTLMYGQPFEGFSPGPDEQALGERARRFLVDLVQRCIDDGRMTGSATDIAHGALGLAIGLATQETAGWLGRSRASRDRRWAQAVDALIAGYRVDRG